MGWWVGVRTRGRRLGRRRRRGGPGTGPGGVASFCLARRVATRYGRFVDASPHPLLALRALRWVFGLAPSAMMLGGGLVLIGFAAILPPWLELERTRERLVLMQEQTAALAERSDRYQSFLVQLDRGDEALLDRLAHTQLRLQPAGRRPLEIDGGALHAPADVAAWLDVPLPDPAPPAAHRPPRRLPRRPPHRGPDPPRRARRGGDLRGLRRLLGAGPGGTREGPGRGGRTRRPDRTAGGALRPPASGRSRRAG